MREMKGWRGRYVGMGDIGSAGMGIWGETKKGREREEWM